MKLKYKIDCRLKKKHRYSIVTGRCIVCNKKKSETTHSKAKTVSGQIN